MGHKNSKQQLHTQKSTTNTTLQSSPIKTPNNSIANTNNTTKIINQTNNIVQPKIQNEKKIDKPKPQNEHSAKINLNQNQKSKQTKSNGQGAKEQIKQKAELIPKKQTEFEWETQFGKEIENMQLAVKIKINNTKYGWIILGICPSVFKSKLGNLQLDISKCIAYNGGSGNAWAFGQIIMVGQVYFQPNQTIEMSYNNEKNAIIWSKNKTEIAHIGIQSIKCTLQKYSPILQHIRRRLGAVAKVSSVQYLNTLMIIMSLYYNGLSDRKIVNCDNCYIIQYSILYCNSMILTNKQYFNRKQQMKQCKSYMKNQIVKLAIFVLICVLLASLITKNSAETSYTFYYAQNKVVNKHTRGVFPPLDGSQQNLYGSWNIEAKIGQDQMDLQNFKNYIIDFEINGRMIIKKKLSNCSSNRNLLIYNWKAYSYNLFISKVPSQIITQEMNSTNARTDQDTNSTSVSQNKEEADNNKYLTRSDSQTNSTAEAQPIQCFNPNQVIFEYVSSFTVWTIYKDNIYLISQAILNGNFDVSIFVLSRLH